MLEFSALWHPYLPSQNISEGKPNQPTNKGPAISFFFFFRSAEVSHLYVLTVVYVFLLLDSRRILASVITLSTQWVLQSTGSFKRVK